MESKAVRFRTYFVVWGCLLVLTATTIEVAAMNLGAFSVLGALLIASVKSTLVLLFFMHLLYERPLFKVMVLAAIGTLTVFIGMTFLDILYR